jgi:hypothetical protein
MATVTLQISGLKQAIANLKGLEGRLANFSGITRDLMLAVQADVDERFASAPDVQAGGIVFGGVDWPHLSDAYLNRNPRRIGGAILRDTGELQQSYGLGGTGNVAIARPTEIIFGSNLPKARGLANKRPQIVVHPELIEECSAIVAHYLGGNLV